MSAVTPPARGFSQAEFEDRTERAQRRMRELEIDVMLLTTEPQVRYFSGFPDPVLAQPHAPLVPAGTT